MDERSEFERDWISIQRMLAGAATLKEIAELCWLKGRVAGMDAGMRLLAPNNGISPEAGAKLAAVTIGETFHHGHYEDVLRAQKQIG